MSNLTEEEYLLSTKQKRLVLLYKLGVHIEEPHCHIIKKIFDFLTSLQKVEVVDFSGRLNICYIDTHNNILFCTRELFENGKELILSDLYSQFFIELGKSFPPPSEDYMHFLVSNIFNNIGITYNKIMAVGDERHIRKIAIKIKKGQKFGKLALKGNVPKF